LCIRALKLQLDNPPSTPEKIAHVVSQVTSCVIAANAAETIYFKEMISLLDTKKDMLLSLNDEKASNTEAKMIKLYSIYLKTAAHLNAALKEAQQAPETQPAQPGSLATLGTMNQGSALREDFDMAAETEPSYRETFTRPTGPLPNAAQPVASDRDIRDSIRPMDTGSLEYKWSFCG
jgi:hypothetical protein